MREGLPIDPEKLQKRGRSFVEKLQEERKQRRRKYPGDIEAVLVFSGPGTYYDRLKQGQSDWERWLDRDRIRAGVAVVREITASRLSEERGQHISSATVKPTDIVVSGPFFIYNGIPEENKVFRKALASDPAQRKIPLEKVLIIDEVYDKGAHPICHTADQVKSFFQALRDQASPLHDVTRVALVANMHDLRIPFYIKKYQDEFREQSGQEIKFFIYGIKARTSEIEEQYYEHELPRLVTYAEKGHLAIEPIVFENLK